MLHSVTRIRRSTLSRPDLVDLEQRERVARGVERHGPVGADLGVVAHPLEQPVGDSGRAAAPGRDLARTLRVELDAEYLRGAHQDRREVVDLVVVEPGDEAEAVAQRAGDESGARGRANEREPRQVEADGARRRTFSDHDVELEVLHRGVQHLFDRARQSVHLIDEQHAAVVEVGEDRGQVAGPFERGTARGLHARTHLSGDDAGEGRLAEAGWTREQHVVDRLPRCADAVSMISRCSRGGLADEVVEPPRPQRRLFRRLDRVGLGAEQLFSPAHREPANTRSASRRRSSTVPSSSRWPSTPRTSSDE